ncbi:MULTISPECIES: hypothetical protein [unclassified Fibrobacter]|uniref:hypothetical protein n=1 Tax=unclassified Fibrobacter TaxID=2634177 RepID=UPI0025C3BA27|nr:MULTISPECIES: hypothetical protein [unclassified Fibrobacter]
MKKMLFFLIVAIFPALAMASPFGLKMGMTIKDIAKECEGKPEFVKNDAYLIKPKKSHPSFEHYIVYVDKNKGLYQIKAISSDINTNDYGTELQTSFNATKDRIAKKYGEPLIRDEIDPGSVFHDASYWMYTLKGGARTLAAIWGQGEKLDDSLDMVVLECSASERSTRQGYLVLYYYFKNAEKIEDEQDSVF